MIAKAMYSRNKLCTAQKTEISPISWCGNFVETFFAICPKLCGNSAFAQNLQTRKLGEITVFYAVKRPRFKELIN